MDSLDVVVYGHKASTSFTSLQLESYWKVNQIPSADFCSGGRAADTKMLVVFLDDSVDQSLIREALADCASFAEYRIKICVFCTPPQSINNQLALLFNDFVFSPCTINEFIIRLKLLKKQYLPLDDKKNYQPMLEEFARLNLRGGSDNFAKTLTLIKQTARCDASVLIEGETGTGKENAARAIHYLGERRDGAFVPINCGAIPDSLLESELFGYEKGAFTDARQKQTGLVALANKGTLFLDEVDSLSPKAQAALLRFLQTGEYRPLGGGNTLQSNVRIVAATNANLAERVQHKKFREDLYFRLNVLYVRMPPLRERPDDVEIIAEYLMQKYLDQYGKGPTRIHAATLRNLKSRPWPGNVRELENVLLREFLLCPGEQIEMAPAPYPMNRSGAGSMISPGKESSSVSFQQTVSFQEAKEAAISEFECGYLQNLLTMTEGNVTEAARLAGKERRCLGKLIKKYNIDKSKFSGHHASV